MGAAEDAIRRRKDAEAERVRQMDRENLQKAEALFPQLVALASEIALELNRLEWVDSSLSNIGGKEMALYTRWANNSCRWGVGSDRQLYAQYDSYDTTYGDFAGSYLALADASNWGLSGVESVLADMHAKLAELQARQA